MATEASCVDKGLIRRAEDIVHALRGASLSVVTAESCTAGLISAVLSQADGAGEVLHGSFVTYSKANKAMALDVDSELLKRDGSVNADVARQLAQGALMHSPADIALAVTGVLGPDRDEDGNPVGLVFFGYGHRNRPVIVSRKDYGKQDHDELRRQVVMDALDLLGQAARKS
jgi:nicotinamide-nucleotide amidase